MNTKISKIFFILVLTILMPGCWDYTDIEELSFPDIVAYDTYHMGRDKNVEGARLTVTMLFPEQTISGSGVYLNRTAGSTIGEIRNKRSFSSSKKTTFREAKVTLIGEQLARREMNMDILLRQTAAKKSMLIAVVKGRGDDLLDKGIEKDKKLANTIVDLLRVTPKEAFIVNATLNDFAIIPFTPGKNMVAPLIELNENKEVRIAGTAIFKKTRMIDTIDQDETRALVLLSGIKGKAYIDFAMYEKGKLIDRGTVYMSNKREVKVYKKDDKYHFDITIILNGDLIEHFNIKNFDEMLPYNKKIEKAVEERIKKECEDFIVQMQEEFKVDCIDISKFALAKWRSQLEKEIDNEDFITNAVINVKVKAKLDDIGERT
ncbi:MAG: Ger(x)C family spore germination protein [Syntrophomonadaceae bacterium]|nr:Ger(x)C family spore germination protein [Syntrophomonadaceae bacterium]